MNRQGLPYFRPWNFGLKVHAARVVGPFPLLVSGMQAGILQWMDLPEEWGQGGRGLGRRYAAVTGSNAARNLFAFALDASLKQDSRYFRSDQKAAAARSAGRFSRAHGPRPEHGGTLAARLRLWGGLPGGRLAAALARRPKNMRCCEGP
jgi:hypothetical protein